MKRFVCLLVATAALLALTACGDGGQTANKAGGSTASTVDKVLNDGIQKAEGTVTVTDEPAELPESLLGPVGNRPETEYTPEDLITVEEDGTVIDVDLTKLNSIMIYSEVSNMMIDPQSYVGKTIRMQGRGASVYYEDTDTTYYSVIIDDATACCAQGIEYTLSAEYEYPGDEQVVTVTGVFETYEEFGYLYCRLANSVIEA